VNYVSKPEFVARLEAVRKAKADAIKAAQKGPTIDDLLAESSLNANQVASGRPGEGGAAKEAKTDIRKIDIQASLYKKSDYREQLAQSITDPSNRYFSRSFVNRVWKTLIGRGFVEPVDDFREDNPPVHPAAMDHLADEFVASDYDLRTLVRMIVTSDAYQRAHAPREADELTRQEMETNLLATPMRRMIAEALFDSVVTAGHLFQVKHSPGKNEKTLVEKIRVPKGAKPGELVKAGSLIGGPGGNAMAMAGPMAMAGGGGYALESGIEVDFGAVLKEAAKEEVEIEEMKAMSREEIEAMRMQQERGGRMQYEEKTITKVIDDNPVYNTSTIRPSACSRRRRMATSSKCSVSQIAATWATCGTTPLRCGRP
jgi:DNA-binding protein H-NS